MSDQCENGQQKYCDERFHNINKSLDHIDGRIEKILILLQGNGKTGLILDIDRLKQSYRKQAKILWIVVGSIIPIVLSIISKRFFNL
jgi:hypothetical protein